MKPIIVVFIGGYLPGKKYGGPVTSIENFVNQFSDIYDIRIICNDHDFKESKRYETISLGWNKVGNALVYYTNEKNYSEKNFQEIISDFSSRIICFYLSGVYYIKMNYNAIKVSRKHNIPVILAPRGDLMKSTIAMKSYKKKIKKLVFLNVVKLLRVFRGVFFQATSDEEDYGAKRYLGIPSDYIYNIPNLPVVYKKKKQINKKKNTLHILFISRLMVKKNPLLAIQIIEKVDPKYNIIFDIYGPKEDISYWKKCEEAIESANINNERLKINYLGSLNPEEAKDIYRQYDCFLFPTASENYGHVIVEAMFSDCPVILSKGTTPWDDYNNNGGYVIELQKKDDFVNVIEKLARMDNIEYKNLIIKNREYTEKKFQLNKLRQKYKEMIEQVS